jgi:hypothetical protein
MEAILDLTDARLRIHPLESEDQAPEGTTAPMHTTGEQALAVAAYP